MMFVFYDMSNSGITDSKKESFIIEFAFVIHRQKQRTCQDQTVSSKRCAHIMVDSMSYRGVQDMMVVNLIQIRGDTIVGIRCGRQCDFMKWWRSPTIAAFVCVRKNEKVDTNWGGEGRVTKDGTLSHGQRSQPGTGSAEVLQKVVLH